MAPKVRRIYLKEEKEKVKEKEKVISKYGIQKDEMKSRKPGQKYATPEETDSLRIFYTSLLKQRPNSEMALKWCLERGVLTEKKAQAAILTLGMKNLKVK